MERHELLNVIAEYAEENLPAKLWMPHREKFVPGKTQIPATYPELNPIDVANLVDTVLNFWYTDYKQSEKFKRLLCETTKQEYATLTNSGSSANLLALTAVSRIFSKKLVLTCATGFPTTVAPIYQNNKIPVYIDIDPFTFQPKYEEIDAAFEKYENDIAGSIFAHTLGFPYDEWQISIHPGFSIADCCFVANTKIQTFDGEKPISDVVVGDYVLTRFGYKKVLSAKKTGRKPVISRIGLRGTSSHPIITKNGIIALDALRVGDIIITWNPKLSSIEEKSIVDTQMLNSDNTEFIFGHQEKIEHHYIGKCGLTLLEKYLKAFWFITKMEILLIIQYPILKLFQYQNMPKFISMTLEDEKKLWKILAWLESKLQSGIKAMKGNRRTKLLDNYLGNIDCHLQKLVWCVEKNIKRIFLEDQNIALQIARTEVDICDVYNLNIEDAHEFFANNILVHNCDAIGAKHSNGLNVGEDTDISTYSFFPAHQIFAGECGAVLTDNEELNSIIESLNNWGRSCYCKPGQSNTCGHRFDWQEKGKLPEGYDHKYIFDYLGYNFKPTEFQAALGFSQLLRLDRIVEDRQVRFQLLSGFIEDIPRLQTVLIPSSSVPSPFGFPIICETLEDAQSLIAYLEDHKISTRKVFAGNITKQPGYMNLPYIRMGNLDGSDFVMNNVFWIGCHPNLTIEMLNYMMTVIEDWSKK